MSEMKATQKRPAWVTVIVIVNVFGWITTEGMWVVLHLTNKIPAISVMNSFFERSYIGLVNGFTIADAIWSNLSLLFSIVGLWKMKAWGWAAAIMANTIWLYSMTFTIVRDLLVTITPAMIFFSFFAIFALVSTIYLWNNRYLFWQNDIAQHRKHDL
ncbi:MAG TPA: hypothetical protein VEF53_21640 [Patescibacteria group bacterium]|nr:hypothetical protein [Patescibacteria group bacterium]